MKKLIVVVLLGLMLTIFSISYSNVAAMAGQTPSNQLIVSKFKIGSTEYTINGEKRTMDVAPYIENGRTMMPVRFTAYAMNVDESGIRADRDGQGATINRTDSGGGKDGVYFKVGSKIVQSAGIFTEDRVAPENRNNRIFVPMRTVAQALGGAAFFNPNTQEVTIVTWKDVPAKTKKPSPQPTSLTISKHTHPDVIMESPNGGHMVDVAKYIQLWGIPQENILYYVEPATQQAALIVRGFEWAEGSTFMIMYTGEKFVWWAGRG
ncbi:copper amine oxidase N-terminal domain-containing protein [Heliorestis acidaminivorans]|uniref:Copper amine oxidase N-terminal domain-containing protein n=1 Tax=Heliorestis acidaminivorans TaxID=553427 RepID=A0A6I0ERB2_9FIRM|nr:copper amine oxidase N-terminal domain-containing protein [Heliorestis acidaminivorans]KAB2952899.1 copper amine oxidase N-terminal domain-containing protein [Heliorestis acidaminivorans]